MFKAALASWRTTLTACILAVDSILHAVSALIDGDPATNPDWNTVVVMVVAAIGLFFARDASVSSQESGIRP
jgi:hypothetical protein